MEPVVQDNNVSVVQDNNVSGDDGVFHEPLPKKQKGSFIDDKEYRSKFENRKIKSCCEQIKIIGERTSMPSVFLTFKNNSIIGQGSSKSMQEFCNDPVVIEKFKEYMDKSFHQNPAEATITLLDIQIPEDWIFLKYEDKIKMIISFVRQNNGLIGKSIPWKKLGAISWWPSSIKQENPSGLRVAELDTIIESYVKYYGRSKIETIDELCHSCPEEVTLESLDVVKMLVNSECSISDLKEMFVISAVDFGDGTRPVKLFEGNTAKTISFMLLDDPKFWKVLVLAAERTMCFLNEEPNSEVNLENDVWRKEEIIFFLHGIANFFNVNIHLHGEIDKFIRNRNNITDKKLHLLIGDGRVYPCLRLPNYMLVEPCGLNPLCDQPGSLGVVQRCPRCRKIFHKKCFDECPCEKAKEIINRLASIDENEMKKMLEKCRVSLISRDGEFKKLLDQKRAIHAKEVTQLMDDETENQLKIFAQKFIAPLMATTPCALFKVYKAMICYCLGTTIDHLDYALYMIALID